MQSKCGFCQDTAFELAELAPKGAKFKVWALRCLKGKHIVGVLDWNDSGALDRNLHKKLDQILAKLSK